MTLQQKSKLIDDLIEENQDVTIKEYVSTVEELRRINNYKGGRKMLFKKDQLVDFIKSNSDTHTSGQIASMAGRSDGWIKQMCRENDIKCRPVVGKVFNVNAHGNWLVG